MARFRPLTLGLTLAAVLTIDRAAAADPVRITSGFLSIDGDQNLDSRNFLRFIAYDFSTESFRLQGGEGDEVARYNVFSPILAHRPSADFTPSGGSSVVARPQAALVINTTPSSTLTPFQLSGTLSIIAFGGGTLFDDAVFGSGTATWGFVLAPDGTPVVSRVRYQFEDVAPTPEPATLVLLAAGLGMVAVRQASRTD